MYINRIFEAKVEKELFKGKLLVVYGARRVGKTTLVKKVLEKYNGLYLNCDEPDVRKALAEKTSTELRQLFGHAKLVVIDEAQRVPDIGLTLKLIVDVLPEIQVIATGSSSFDLSNRISEPLTGRSVEIFLPPLLLSESNADKIEASRLLEHRLIFGMYPEVVTNFENNERQLEAIAKNYLYKDALEYSGIKNPDVIEKLVTALALQIGSEVSFTELANLLGIDQKTVASYIRLLEQAFIIFRLSPLSRNLRKEISKSRKIYFWDLGIRNAIIKNFNSISLRNDVGQLWENFLIIERIKYNLANDRAVNNYFWRTWDGQEVDYIEESGGILEGVEVKWQKIKAVGPKKWNETYPDSSWKSYNKDNFWEYVGY